MSDKTKPFDYAQGELGERILTDEEIIAALDLDDEATYKSADGCSMTTVNVRSLLKTQCHKIASKINEMMWLDGGVACFDGRRILDFIRELEGLPVERKKK